MTEDLGEQYDTRTSFIDMLLSGQMNLFILLMIAMAMVNPVTENKGKVDKKAEMVLSVEWNPSIDCDVDTWIKGPDDTVVWYNSKEGGYMNIERDDTGTKNDRYIDRQGKEVYNPVNVEYWTLRQLVAGEYLVNVYSYACRINDTDLEKIPNGKIDVTITLMDLNPSADNVSTKKFVIDQLYEEYHVFRFHVNTQGAVDRVWEEPAQIVTSHRP